MTSPEFPRMEKEGLIMYKNDDTRQLYLIKPTGAVEALPKKYSGCHQLC